MHLQRRLALLSGVPFGQRLHHSCLGLPDLPLGVGVPGSRTLCPISWQMCPFRPLWQPGGGPSVGDQLGFPYHHVSPQRVRNERGLEERASSLVAVGPRLLAAFSPLCCPSHYVNQREERGGLDSPCAPLEPSFSVTMGQGHQA